MGTIDLIKKVKELAHDNGEDMSFRTAAHIVYYMINTGLIAKVADQFGNVEVKTGTPKVK